MEAKELAEKLLEYPDFELDFTFLDGTNSEIQWPNYRTFENIEIGDIGYSEKIISLNGNERD